MAILVDVKPGTIHKSNKCGSFKIISYKNARNVLVEFIDTGYRKVVQTASLRKGSIKDLLYPSFEGVGFVGEGIYCVTKDNEYTPAGSIWQGMITRCYSDRYHKIKPTYSNCEVSEEWQDFQKFAEWFYDNYPNDDGDYHLDKDFKVPGNKLYSSDTCMFLDAKINSGLARGKHAHRL